MISQWRDALRRIRRAKIGQNKEPHAANFCQWNHLVFCGNGCNIETYEKSGSYSPPSRGRDQNRSRGARPRFNKVPCVASVQRQLQMRDDVDEPGQEAQRGNLSLSALRKIRNPCCCRRCFQEVMATDPARSPGRMSPVTYPRFFPAREASRLKW